MKKIMPLLCLLFLIAEFVNGQLKDTSAILLPQPLYESYMHKRKVNNTAGWITLGTGVVMMGVGIYIDVMEHIESTYGTGGQTVFYLGATSTLASIPLFIAAGKNKRLANLSLKKESVFIGNKIPFKPDYTAIAFTIHF